MKNPTKSLKKDWKAYVNTTNSNLLSKIEKLKLERKQMQELIENKETSIVALIERTIELQNTIHIQSRNNNSLLKKIGLLKDELTRLENLTQS